MSDNIDEPKQPDEIVSPEEQIADLTDKWKRTAADFENFLKEGSPISGAYMCRVFEGDTLRNTLRRIILRFDSIAAIG